MLVFRCVVMASSAYGAVLVSMTHNLSMVGRHVQWPSQVGVDLSWSSLALSPVTAICLLTLFCRRGP